MAKQILVVDDEPDILKVVVFRLKKMGYEVITAIDGQGALDLIRKRKPDLILLDLRIPVIDGYEVCKQLKADEGLKMIPVILLTASVGVKIEQKTRELNANDYIIKPFSPKELIKKVEKYIR